MTLLIGGTPEKNCFVGFILCFSLKHMYNESECNPKKICHEDDEEPQSPLCHSQNTGQRLFPSEEQKDPKDFLSMHHSRERRQARQIVESVII
jgi:hypothetical protein